MKLVTFKIHTEERLGAYFGNQIVDLNSAYAVYLRNIEGKESARRWSALLIPPSMKEFLESGDESVKAAKKTLDFISREEKTLQGLDGEKIVFSEDQIRLCAPIPRPGKVYCLAVNFYDHAASAPSAGIKSEKRIEEIQRLRSLNLNIPFVFQKPPSVVCGPRDPIIIPRSSNKVDYENELAVIIGKRGKYIPKERAYEYVGGYTIINDVSFRDRQRFPTDIPFWRYKSGVNWTKGKGMDNAAPMGPCLVSKEDIPDPYSPPLRIVTRVNGVVRQNNDLSSMIISIPRLIEYLSDGTTLEPGDVIATGTVFGGAQDWDSYLKIGDIVECEIQPIGILKQEVIGD